MLNKSGIHGCTRSANLRTKDISQFEKKVKIFFRTYTISA